MTCFSSYTAFLHQMFLVKSDELASVFSHQNKPVFNVEDVEKYGFGAIPDCSGKINFMTKCVRSILSKVRSVEHSHRNICEMSRDLFVSTIFRALSANGNPEVLTCSPALTSNAAQPPAATVKSSSLISSPSRITPDGMGGMHASSRRLFCRSVVPRQRSFHALGRGRMRRGASVTGTCQCDSAVMRV